MERPGKKSKQPMTNLSRGNSLAGRMGYGNKTLRGKSSFRVGLAADDDHSCLSKRGAVFAERPEAVLVPQG
jgi:hypothetical protein